MVSVWETAEGGGWDANPDQIQPLNSNPNFYIYFLGFEYSGKNTHYIYSSGIATEPSSTPSMISWGFFPSTVQPTLWKQNIMIIKRETIITKSYLCWS